MMQIFPVTEELLPVFFPMLPPSLSDRTDYILGASVDGIECGVVVLEPMGHRQSISWLWVDPMFRQRGVGSMLLNRVCEVSFDQHGEKMNEISISWPMDAPWAPILERMLAKRGFLCKSHPIQCLRVTRQELEQAPLMTIPFQPDHAISVISLESLPRIQRNSMRMECEEAGLYQISRADYHLADHHLSQILLHHDQVAGIALVREVSPGIISLDLLGIKKGHTAGGLALLRTAAQAALKHGLNELVFDSVEESATRLASRLLGQDGQTTFLCRGRLSSGAYRMEGQ